VRGGQDREWLLYNPSKGVKSGPPSKDGPVEKSKLGERDGEAKEKRRVRGCECSGKMVWLLNEEAFDTRWSLKGDGRGE